MKKYRVSGKEAGYTAIGIGLATFLYGLLSGSLQFWMAPVAFITSAFYAGWDRADKNPWNATLNFGMGILWGFITWNLFQVPGMNMLLWTSGVFGTMALLACLVQGFVLKSTHIAAWFVAWGTFMEITLNIKIQNWLVFVVQLFACMLLGVFFLDYGSDFVKFCLYHLFPEKEDINS